VIYIIIKPENTAISNGISNSAIILSENSKPSQLILDYGAGKLRNSIMLLNLNLIVDILDLQVQIEKLNKPKILLFPNIYTPDNLPSKEYNNILCSFVLNVIPNLVDRTQVLINIHKFLKLDGYAYFEVRKNKGISANKNNESYNDGVVTGKGNIRTFQKPYDQEEIICFLKNNKFKIINCKNFNDSIVIITCKEN